jgi:hypothetical protein
MRCGNCAAFIQTPEMIECITKGIEPDQEEDELTRDVIDAADLGYCELFHFKCAAARTCSAWLRGGPITKSMSDRQKNMIDMARIEYDVEDEDEYEEDEE